MILTKMIPMGRVAFGKMKTNENWYSDEIKKRMINEEPSQVIEIDGIGICKVYGKWDAEKIVTRLLESDKITDG